MNLYKFLKIDKKRLDALIKKSLWFSRVDKLNDPFEFEIKILPPNDPLYFNSLDFQKYIQDFGVTCFSEENDNSVMWARYGDNHKGFCLGFEFVPQPESFGIYKVFYEDYLPEFHPQPWHVERTARALNTKSKQWQNEKEWRMIITSDYHKEIQEDGGKLVPWTGILKEVIFGCHCSTKNINKIKKILKDEKVDFYQIEKDLSSRKLLAVSI